MRRTVQRVAVGLAVVLGLGLSGLMCQRVAERGRYVGAFSTYGAGPEGTRGLFLLADRLGAHPRRWAEELGRLPEGGMLVALGSCEEWMRRDLGRVERETLTAWVNDGGVLVVAGVHGYSNEDDLGVDLIADPAACRPQSGLVGMLARAEERSRRRKRPSDEEGRDLEDLGETFDADPAAAYEEAVAQDELASPEFAYPTGEELERLPAVALRRPMPLRVDESRPHRTLLRLDGPDGEVAGVRVDVGEGAVVALSSASLFQNRDLSEHRGGLLFARLVRELAPEGPVLFDEYHLGVGQRRSMARYLRQVGLAPVIVQVLLLVGLLLWRFGFRFGSPREEPPAEPGGTASYVEGVGTLYEKAADATGTLSILTARALERVAAHHHLQEKSADAIARLLDERGRKDAAEAVRDLGRLEGERVSSRALSRKAAAIDRLSALAMQ